VPSLLHVTVVPADTVSSCSGSNSTKRGDCATPAWGGRCPSAGWAAPPAVAVRMEGPHMRQMYKAALRKMLGVGFITHLLLRLGYISCSLVSVMGNRRYLCRAMWWVRPCHCYCHCDGDRVSGGFYVLSLSCIILASSVTPLAHTSPLASTTP
jgi:hypothetical protein